MCFRTRSSTEADGFLGMFYYLEDELILKDKTGMWECIAAVSDKVFKTFLDAKADMVCTSVVGYCSKSGK